MLNWSDKYDRFNWAASAQLPLTESEKRIIEQLGVDVLGLDSTTAARCWGTAHEPGRHAHTVIKIRPDVPHRFSKHGQQLGFKIFNAGKDCPWMGPKMVEFQTTQRHLLPGLPNAHVQEVFAGGLARTPAGVEHGYLIQQWVEGEVLGSKIGSGLGADDALWILDDLFLQIIIPLWSRGTAWWDVRDSNYVFTPEKRLVMIDSDTLAADLEEIIAASPVYDNRNKHTKTAMIRYRATIGRMVASCLRSLRPRKNASNERAAMDMVTEHLFPTFCSPYPLTADWSARATRAYRTFRQSAASAFTVV